MSGVTLGVWQFTENSPRLIVPVIDKESPLEATQRYINSFKENPLLRELVPKAYQNIELYSLQGSFLSEWPKSSRPKLAFIANWAEDLEPNGERINRNIQRFQQAGSDPFVIPISADLGLSLQETRAFHLELARHFDILVALGGDHIATELYQKQNMTSPEDWNSNITRDRSEFNLISAYKTLPRLKKGLFFGICRGHQFNGLIDGHELRSIGKAEADHFNSTGDSATTKQTWHPVSVEESSLLARLLRGFLHPLKGNRFFSKENEAENFSNRVGVVVNSIHQQVVILREDAISRPVAFHSPTMIEALESVPDENNKIISLSIQFHGEFPQDISKNEEFSLMGFALIKRIIALSRRNLALSRSSKNACLPLFRFNSF
ncbi:MAG: gamma-glutamyl-gamma-aminobutyrate hydrolase family protein [Bdellovibrionales bacterium]|nr:gamma-glutamyl-gamma-aminobutyrate hydrolase family protein [Bdellovibrionales bacterium]